MSQKSPAFQWYPADYLSDMKVRMLSWASRGLYMELICYCWREGYIPSDSSAIAQLTGCHDLAIIEPCLSLFISHPEDSAKLIHKRLDAERRKQFDRSNERSESGKKGAKSRWGNKTSNKKSPDSLANGSAIEKPLAKNSSSSSSSSSLSAEREPAHAPEQARSVKTADNTSPPPTKTVTPSWPEVKARADLIGLAEWKAKDWWEEMEGCGWLDHLKRPVASWGAVLSRVKTKWEADGRPKGPPSNASKPLNGASRPFQPRAKAESCL